MRDQVFSGGTYFVSRQLQRLGIGGEGKAMCILKDVNMGMAVKPWECKCI